MLRQITSKYNGRCKSCKTHFNAGQTIYWSRETGALCFQCGADQSGKTGAESKAQSVESTEPISAPSEIKVPEIKSSAGKKGNEPYYSIDWRDLREILRDALFNKRVRAVKRKANEQQILSWTQNAGQWHGFTVNQLKRWVTEGYRTDAIKGLGDFTPPLRDKRRYQFVEDGEEIYVDRVLSGEDNYMGQWTKREVIPGASVECEIMFCSVVDASVVNAYNVWICRMVYALEMAGIDCDVTLKFSGRGVFPGKGEGMSHSIVKVKGTNERTDFVSISPMLSPAAFRSFGFTAMTLNAESHGVDVHGSLGYGHNGTEWSVVWDDERKTLKVNCPYTPRGSFPSESMDEKFRAALKKMTGK